MEHPAYYQVNLKIDFWQHKNTWTHYADHCGIIEIFFQPILLNDDSKEPEGSAENRHVSSGIYGWFWVFVKLHIQNSEDKSCGCLYKGFLKFEFKKVYNNITVQLPMFILVSLPLGLVTGGLLGPPWSTFWFLQIGRDFCVYMAKGCTPKKIKKSKKSNHVSVPF